jgi:hypothetical protein
LLWYYYRLHSPAEARPLYSTSYPHYLTRDATDQHKAFPEISIDLLKDGGKLRQDVSRLYDATARAGIDTGMPGEEDWEQQLWNLGDITPSTRDEIYRSVISAAGKLWGERSYIVANAAAFKQARVGQSGTLPDEQIAYIRVECSDGADDGGVFVRLRGSFREHTFNGQLENVIRSNTFTGHVNEGLEHLNYDNLAAQFRPSGRIPA